jgi:hypothetical protein
VVVIFELFLIDLVGGTIWPIVGFSASPTSVITNFSVTTTLRLFSALFQLVVVVFQPFLVRFGCWSNSA